VTLPMFDKVFEWDPDFFPARIEKAAEYRKAGQPREAERMLRPYIDSRDPKVADNCRLLYEMGAIYTDWYIQGGSEKETADASRLAEEAFTKLHRLNPRHATGWIKRAELYTVAGTRAKRKDTLKDARQWLANAREILKTDTPEMQRIAKQISEAEKGSTTRASTREAQR
jgi:tetratricopeptide (TPR) repeat protein